MTLQIDFWQLVLLLVAFFGACAGGGKLLLSQTQRHLDDRFKAQEDARAANHSQLSLRLDGIEQASREEANQWQRVERELMNLKAEMPLHYVRREDAQALCFEAVRRHDGVADRGRLDAQQVAAHLCPRQTSDQSDFVLLFGTTEIKATHEHEHEKGAPDPHFWLDPPRAVRVIDPIAEAFEKLAPGGGFHPVRTIEEVA